MATTTVERLYEEMLDLDDSEREELLGRFGFLPDDWQPSPAWRAEIKRRIERFRAGDPGVSLEEFERRFHAGR